MYVVERVPALSGAVKRAYDARLRTEKVPWIVFDTVDMRLTKIEISGLTMGTRIGIGQFDSSLIFVLEDCRLRLIAKRMRHQLVPSELVYSIKIHNEAHINSGVCLSNLSDAITVFCNENKEFVDEYNKPDSDDSSDSDGF
jgi:hypothetical protein